MSQSLKEILFSKNVVEFAAVAKEYCAFIENVNKYSRKDFIKLTASLLPLLYYKASMLPKTEPVYEDGNQKHVTEEYYIALNLRIKDLLGEHDAFPEVFDSRIAETDEQFSASIAEYLSDVYQDLKNFTMLYQNGQVEEMNDALWECTLNFQEYWGIRLANAIRAIHILSFGNVSIEEDAEDNQTAQNVDTSQWFMTQRQKEMDKEDL
jgi:hypothetical protein